ncbi:DNA modification methylase [Microbacterium rhizomatis]|uniref:DNA modification methylase n=1 Tax=Microbacterium rhizomatis TaxID=1631477 RepID=A0A5J5J2X8_9MICO|nr:DNA modification methylase [Microbacterium rhizomatis]KAA9107538.1 DNA modification methylase [Microbacterium rhizomatis]
MKSRLIASLAVGAAILLGTTGCSLLASQATTIPYSPSDGVTVAGSAPLKVRNALIVANEDGTVGNFVAAIVNDTSDPQVLSIEAGDGSIKKTVRVPANTTVSLGAEDTKPLRLEGINTKPGANLDMYFQSGDLGGVLATVPVLDGTLDYLTALAPR